MGSHDFLKTTRQTQKVVKTLTMLGEKYCVDINP